MARINKDFAKGVKADGTPDYAPGAFSFGGRDYLHPTDADYASAGYKRVVDAPPAEPEPAGYHYERRGWEVSRDGSRVEAVYEAVPDPAPAPRRWSRLSLKTAFARAGMLDAVLAYLSGVEVAPGYTAEKALTDCDYIEEGFGGAEAWGAMLDGAAQALGKSRAEIDSFLDSIPAEGGD